MPREEDNNSFSRGFVVAYHMALIKLITPVTAELNSAYDK